MDQYIRLGSVKYNNNENKNFPICRLLDEILKLKKNNVDWNEGNEQFVTVKIKRILLHQAQ